MKNYRNSPRVNVGNIKSYIVKQFEFFQAGLKKEGATIAGEADNLFYSATKVFNPRIINSPTLDTSLFHFYFQVVPEPNNADSNLCSLLLAFFAAETAGTDSNSVRFCFLWHQKSTLNHSWTSYQPLVIFEQKETLELMAKFLKGEIPNSQNERQKFIDELEFTLKHFGYRT